MRNFFSFLSLLFKRYSSSSFFVSAPQIISMIVGIITLPIILNNLPTKDYGVLQFVLTIQLWMIVFSGGNITLGSKKGIAEGKDGTFFYAFLKRLKLLIVIGILGILTTVFLWNNSYFAINNFAELFLILNLYLIFGYLPQTAYSEYFIAKKKFKELAFFRIFSGTLVISGKVTTVVVSTGKDTVFGGIVKTVSGIKRESAYEKSILYFSKLILKIVTVTIFLVFLANVVLKGIDSILELLLFSVALIVSILPEALPAVVSFALSQGSLKLAKQNVVVKRLSAIEDLGNIEVLASDKTGTLTENKMSLTKIISSDKNKSFLYGILGSGSFSFNEKILNPFDYAIFQRAPDEIIRKAKKFKIISELPFDSYRMRSSFLIDGAGKERILIVKGAPETVLNNCNNLGGKNKKQEINNVLYCFLNSK